MPKNKNKCKRIYIINNQHIRLGRDGGAWSNAADSRSVGLGLREFKGNEHISLPA